MKPESGLDPLEFDMKCKSSAKPGRLMLALMCAWVACGAGFALFVENWLGWILFFSPRWANGFPFGLSFQTVLSAGITVYCLLVLLTAAAGVGAIAAFICTLLRVRRQHAGRGWRIWFWTALGFVFISACIFFYVYSMVRERFPDGYDVT
jgi:hypothetical protein